MITERGYGGYDSRRRLTHSWRIFRVNGLPPSLSLSSWVGRQGRTVVYINGAFPPSCTLRIETLTHSPLHCAHAKPFVRCSLRRTTYVRNSRPPPASANSNNFCIFPKIATIIPCEVNSAPFFLNTLPPFLEPIHESIDAGVYFSVVEQHGRQANE